MRSKFALVHVLLVIQFVEHTGAMPNGFIFSVESKYYLFKIHLLKENYCD